MVSGASGGFLVNYPMNLTPGEVIPITIGVGGVSGYRVAGTGGTTIFGSYLSCSGGSSLTDASNSYATPGACNVDGIGTWGQYSDQLGGALIGGVTPLRFGSGGVVGRCDGCPFPNPTTGLSGTPGVVIVDVLY